MNIDTTFELDRVIASEFHKKPCQNCGGKLNWANYHRKPRGVQGDDEKHTLCFSLCCGQDGCRKRTSIPSLRFFGRRVYSSKIFFSISSLSKIATSRKKLERLSNFFNVPVKTIKNWLKWWNNDFINSKAWMIIKGFLVSQPNGVDILSHLYKRMPHSSYGKIYSLQRLFLPFSRWLGRCNQEEDILTQKFELDLSLIEKMVCNMPN